ncbi:MAG: hypothetical protein U0892_15290 [Pirellulales bacterium]
MTVDSKRSNQAALRRSSIHRRVQSRRAGAMMSEVLVAASLVACLAAIVAPLAFRMQRVHLDAVRYRIAVDELRNQADRLTAMSDDSRRKAVVAAELSEFAKSKLPDAELTLQSIDDSDDARLLLTLHWDRGGEAVPPSLVVWLPLSKNLPQVDPVEPNTTTTEAKP